MELEVLQADVTKLEVDAIANAANTQLMHGGGVATLVLLVAGGLAYSVGAVFYALRRPNPWPTVFGHHEFFHACTLVAAISHHIARACGCAAAPLAV